MWISCGTGTCKTQHLVLVFVRAMLVFDRDLRYAHVLFRTSLGSLLALCAPIQTVVLSSSL